jgi:Na+/alanine symporter
VPALLIKKGFKMKKEVIEKLAALITAAFGLVAALAWNDTIKAIFKSAFGSADSVTAMLIYAIIVTVIAVYVTIKIGQVSEKAK